MKTKITLCYAVAVALSGGCKREPATAERLPAPAPRASNPGAALAHTSQRVAWQHVRTLELRGTLHNWEPNQSFIADGPPRDVSEATFTLRDGGVDGWATIAWHREVKYPFVRTYDYVDVLGPTKGEVRGLDSWYFETPPPPRALSSDHFAALWRQVHQISLLDYFGDRAPELEVELDPVTKLPTILRSHDSDLVAGDSTLQVVMSDYQPEGELTYPRSSSFMLNGQTIAELRIEHVRVNPPEPPEPPPQLTLLKSDANAGIVPFEWVMRREAMGGYAEDDSVANPHLQDVAEGVFLVAGRTHNALIVDMGDHLVVVDAPLDEAYGRWIVDTCRQRFPLKPLRTLVLTHHHDDHCGGARALVAAGAEVIVGVGNQQHFERMFSAHHRIENDSLERAPRVAHVREVQENETLHSKTRTLELLRIPNHHAQGMLVAYLPIERIAFVADLWSPGRDQLRASGTFERHQDLVDALRALKITPKLVVGGHGTVGNYAELATAVDAGPSSP